MYVMRLYSDYFLPGKSQPVVYSDIFDGEKGFIITHNKVNNSPPPFYTH